MHRRFWAPWGILGCEPLPLSVQADEASDALQKKTPSGEAASFSVLVVGSCDERRS